MGTRYMKAKKTSNNSRKVDVLESIVRSSCQMERQLEIHQLNLAAVSWVQNQQV